MKKQLVAGGLLVVVLSGVIAFRIHAQNAYKHAPSGGSATLEGTEAVIAAKVGGRLVEVLAQEGDTLTAGQIVARLDCDDPKAALAVAEAQVRQLQAQVERAEAEVSGAQTVATAASAQVAVASARSRSLEVQRTQAERDQARVLALTETGAATAVDLDHVATSERALGAETEEAHASVGAATLSARAQGAGVGTARAQVVVARTGVEVAMAEVARAKIAVADCVLRAPRAGIVVDRLHEPGAVIAPGQSVLTMIDLSTIKAVFYLPNGELARAKVGAPAEVRVDTYPGRVFTGVVRRVSSEAEFTSRNVQTREDRDRLVYAVEVALDNPKLELRAGMPGEVVLPGTQP